jgi:hypothetical protein
MPPENPQRRSAMPNQEREGTGRRTADDECETHRRELDEVKIVASKNDGRFTAMLWALGVIGTVLTLLMTILITKTNGIEALLSDNRVVITQLTERGATLRRDVDGILERNRYVDQSGAVKPIPPKE